MLIRGLRYGVDLYPESGARGAARRRAFTRGIRLGLVAGLGLLLIGAQFLSGLELRERARRLERSIAVLETRLPAGALVDEAPPGGPLDQVRASRTLWSPKLRVLSEVIPDQVFTTEISGVSTEAGRVRRSLEFTAHVEGENPELAPALAMVERLKQSPDLTDDLPHIDVNTARGTRLLTVRISCSSSPSGAGR